MKNRISLILYISLIVLTGCRQEDIKCLKNKEVVLETIVPSARICQTGDDNFIIEPSWDTTTVIVMSECDAIQYIEDLENSWDEILNEYQSNSTSNIHDSLYYEFFNENPPNFSIHDDGGN